MVFSLTSGRTWHLGEVLHLPHRNIAHLNELSILFITLLYVTYSVTRYAIFSIPQSLQPFTSGYDLIYLKTLRRQSLEWSNA